MVIGAVGYDPVTTYGYGASVQAVPAAEQAAMAGGITAVEASGQSSAEGMLDSQLLESKAQARVKQKELTGECRSCRERTYVDGSDDPGVSFKTPGRIDPDAAASVVSAHEQEHVMREQAKATQEGGKVLSQSVTLHNAICAECGRVYVSGGTTRTVTAYKGEGGGQSSPASGVKMDANA